MQLSGKGQGEASYHVASDEKLVNCQQVRYDGNVVLTLLLTSIKVVGKGPVNLWTFTSQSIQSQLDVDNRSCVWLFAISSWQGLLDPN